MVSVWDAVFGIDPTLSETGATDADKVFAVTGTKEGQVLLWAVTGEK